MYSKVRDMDTDKLISTTAHYLKLIVSDVEETTDNYRMAADCFIEMRSLVTTVDGRIDWGGRTYTYRQLAGGAYDEAGIHGAERARIAANVRHHISYMLHARLTAEELEDAGIGPLSSRARQRRESEKRRAIVQAVRNNEVGWVDPMQAVVASRRLVESLTVNDISTLSPRRQRHCVEALVMLQATLDEKVELLNIISEK